MVALTSLTCLTLDRRTFIDILGPLQDIMAKEKSEEVGRKGGGSAVVKQLSEGTKEQLLAYER